MESLPEKLNSSNNKIKKVYFNFFNYKKKKNFYLEISKFMNIFIKQHYKI